MFEQRIICYHNLFSNLSSIDEDYVAYQARIEKKEFEETSEQNRAELVLEILKDRITLSTVLIKLHKFKLAKFVAEVGVNKLMADLTEEENSVKDFLVLLKRDLETKIAYIEEDLHGSAHINEENFKNYFTKILAEEEAYALLEEYEKIKQSQSTVEVQPELIDFNFVAENLQTNGIYVLVSDIERQENEPDKFVITKARTNSGNLFSSKYNATTNVLYDIKIGEEIIKYSLLPSEINIAFSDQDDDSQIIIEPDTTDSSQSNLAFEIKKRTIITIFNDLGININSSNISYKDKDSTMISASIDWKSVTFLLNNEITKASEIEVQDYGKIEGVALLKDLTGIVNEFIQEWEEQILLENLRTSLQKERLMVQTKNIHEISEGIYEVIDIYDTKNTVLFNAEFDVDQAICIEADLWDLGLLQDIQISELVLKITELKVAKKQEEIALNLQIQEETYSGTIIFEEIWEEEEEEFVFE